MDGRELLTTKVKQYGAATPCKLAPSPRGRNDRSQHGGALIGIIAAMLLMGAVSAGIVTTMGTSTMGEVQGNHSTRAYYLAESGFRYLYSSYRADPDGWKNDFDTEPGPTFTPPSGGSFQIKNLTYTSGVNGEAATGPEGEVVYDVNAGGSLNLNDASGFMDYNGTIEIGGAMYRYLHKTGNTLTSLQAIGDSVLPIPINEGDAIDLLPGVTFNSTGTFPATGAMSASRTLTYFLPLLGGSGEGEGEEGGTGIGELALFSNGDIAINKELVIDGDVGTAGNATLDKESEIKGDLSAGGNVTLEKESKVDGSVCAGGNSTLKKETIVGGDINAQGNVIMEKDAEVSGTVYAGGNVALSEDAVIYGDLHSGGNIELQKKNTIGGDANAGGNIDLDDESTIEGNADAGGNITLDDDSTIKGDATAGGDINLDDGSTIEGDALAGGNIELNDGSTVEGAATEGDPNPEPSVPQPPSECQEICVPDHTDFSAGGPDFVDGDLPGSYDELSLDEGGYVSFSAGDYYFNQITSGKEPTINFELNDDDIKDINIFVTGNVSFDKELNILVNGTSLKDGDGINEDLAPLASRVYWEILGDFSMSKESSWFGTIFGAGNISFDKESRLVGAAYSSGGTTTADKELEITYVQANYALENWSEQCGGGGGGGGGGYIPPIHY